MCVRILVSLLCISNHLYAVVNVNTFEDLDSLHQSPAV